MIKRCAKELCPRILSEEVIMLLFPEILYCSGSQPLSDRGLVNSFFYKMRARYRAVAWRLRNTTVKKDHFIAKDVLPVRR
jgi:hypothetical protein